MSKSWWTGLRHRIRLLNRQRLRRRHERRGLSFAQWAESHDRLGTAEREALAARQAALRQPPVIALLMPVYDPPLPLLEAAIASVKAQLYPHWQLCIADDASQNAAVAQCLQAHAAAEPRIRLLRRSANGHICRASNDALALADAPWIGLLDHDDELAEHALLLMAEAIGRFPDAQLLYSDEDKLDLDGTRRDPYFKPDWNPELLLSQHYVGHLAVYAATRLRALGGFRVGFEGAQDHDLTLRFTEGLAPDQVVHVPHVLYHWRQHDGSTASGSARKAYAGPAMLQAVREALARRGLQASVEPDPFGWVQLRPRPPAPAPSVEVLIPTRDGVRTLPRCIDSLLARTEYPGDWQIVVIDNGSRDPGFLGLLERLRATPRCRVRVDDRPFNFAALNNAAVEASRAEMVVLLNDDTEALNADWLGILVAMAAMPGVGAVGARLWYPDRSLQHAGVVLGIGDVAGHAHRHALHEEPGDHGRAALLQNFTAVTAACLAVRRAHYQGVGGMDEQHLAVAFNDVDFCLKLHQRGLRNVYAPMAELVHHESISRGSDRAARHRERYEREARVMQQRWGPLLQRDPAYNPNLTLAAEDFALADPPRVNLRQRWFDALPADNQRDEG